MIDILDLPSEEAREAAAIYAVGDIHGRLDLLEAMETLIADDIAAHTTSRPLICYLGDYIDRGPQSAQVIDRLCRPFQDNIPRVFLKGNHEDRMIEFIQNPTENGPSWMKFGGREALDSYGLNVPQQLEGADWLDLRDRLSSVLSDQQRSFLENLRLGLVWGKYLFVHAGLHPERSIKAQVAHDLMWIREPFLSSERDWGLTVVHGHVIVDEPLFRSNRIAIDTGAYRSGRLTCLVVTHNGVRLLQTVPSPQ